MKTYKTSGVVSLSIGKIGLSEAQAEPRKLFLKKVRGDVYDITGPIQFKAGEVIKLDAIPKPYGHFLEQVKPAKKATEE